MKRNIFILLIVASILIVFSTLIFASGTIDVKEYIKGKLPSIFSFYLSSLEELDLYEKEFIDLLEKLPKEEQEYYAKEVYKNGFSLELLEKLKKGKTFEEPTLDWNKIKEKYEATKEKDKESVVKTEEKPMESLLSPIKRIKPSTLIIFAYDDKGDFLKLGSGFFISQNGDVITNYHVIQGASSAEIKTADEKTYPITYIVAGDEPNDLIRLSVNIPSQDVYPLSLSQTIPEVGERIIVYGSPLGLENTVSDGIVSAIRDFPVEFENRETLSMIMVDYNYDGEVFDFDDVFYEEDINKQDWEICFDVDKINGQNHDYLYRYFWE
jgi:S1-C subfamily serine protease